MLCVSKLIEGNKQLYDSQKDYALELAQEIHTLAQKSTVVADEHHAD